MDIDQKDKKILELLKRDSRLSIRDIAKKILMKPSTVHSRMQKMKKYGIIERFTLKLNNQAIDENFIVFTYLNTAENLPKTFFSNPHLKEAFDITGEYDMLLKLKFKGMPEFNNYLSSLKKNKAITKTITNVVTDNFKEELN